MAVDTQLRASEIKNVLLGEIERYDQALGAEQIGEVLEVKDGIARIYGLMGTMSSEMLEITPSDGGTPVTALALNLEEDNIGAVVLGDWTVIQEGDQVRRTARGLDIPVGPEFLGRVVNPLGEPVDGKGPIAASGAGRGQGRLARRRGAPPGGHRGPGHRAAPAGEGAHADRREGHRRADPHR